MISDFDGYVKPDDKIFFEGFSNIWTIKNITILISFFENLIDGCCSFATIMIKLILCFSLRR
jgi:hypothetical protein